MSEYITKQGLEKLKKELEYLEKVERKNIAERLAEAIAQGDLSENAGYQITKENQFFLEKRIKELKYIIDNAKIIDKPKSNVISLSSVVSLETDKEKIEIQIVVPEEVDIMQGKISFQSPLGKALLGKRKGEKVVIKNQEGISQEYKIIDIS